MPFKSDAFSIVTCRSAFHHMEDCRQVFKEMVRTVQRNGKVCIQDMTSYTDSHVNHFFEELDKRIDPSHHKALSSAEMNALFQEFSLRDVKKVESEVVFNLQEYVRHAQQTEADRKRIAELAEIGRKDSAISQFFFYKNDELHFKKGGMVIVGTKM